MATVEFKGMENYEQMLARLGDQSDEIQKKMVTAGLRVLYAKLKAANTTFSKYLKKKSARKNQFGWFAQVQFKGKTESGVSAALAANVYEHGRGGKNRQPARPWINAACAAAEGEAVQEMSRVYDEEAEKIANH